MAQASRTRQDDGPSSGQREAPAHANHEAGRQRVFDESESEVDWGERRSPSSSFVTAT
jgi:hypothetical protein